MKVTLYGSAGTVTGSAYYVQGGKSNILVDFGIFQGKRILEMNNRKPPPFRLDNLDAVVITHAHLDHTGRLPLLAKFGFRGPIYATGATIEVTRLILLDSVKVQSHDLKRINRKRQRMGQAPEMPVYSEEDVHNVIAMMTEIPYNEYVEIARGCLLRVREAGHILGSVSVEITIEDHKNRKVLIFSGDIGPQEMPIVRDPDPFRNADLVFMESTYGDRDHRSLEATFAEGKEIVERAVALKGKILVPSFAIGRTQQMLYYMARAFYDRSLPVIPIYLDSPMAVEATRIYSKHRELFDEEAEKLYGLGVIRGDLSDIHVSLTPEDSMALNDVEGPCMIIAGAGMCNAGRILHHLRHNLWRPETMVMIVGYQGDGSLGRRLIEGAQKVRIFGEDIAVRAQVASLNGLSAHAGQRDLVRWFDAVAPSKPKLVLSHGEDRARIPLSEILKKKYSLEAILPAYGETIFI